MNELREKLDLLKTWSSPEHGAKIDKTSARIAYAIDQLEKHNIEYVLKNPTTGHFHIRRKTDDTLIQFYAGTGKIVGRNIRGIHSVIRIAEGEL